MKVNILENGWDEVITHQIRIKQISENVFSTAADWIKVAQRIPRLDTGGRNHCQVCSRKWSECLPETKTYLAFTTHGNKILCEDCRQLFKI